MARKRKTPPARDHAAIDAKLDEIEAEMKSIGYWSDDPPPAEPLERYNDIRFHIWLQTHFLPHARDAVRTGVYPEGESAVGLAALRQYDYHEYVSEAQQLKDLLFEFDRLVNAGR